MIATLIVVLCLLPPCLPQASAEDFRVNDDFTTAYQGYSHIATDLAGNFVVSWYDKRAGQNDIFVQFFDHVGNRLGANQQVNDDLAGADQLKPSLIRSQTGETFVAWQDFRITGYPFNGDIYLQKFDSNNNPGGANERVNGDFGVTTQAWQDIAVADNGQFVIVWEDNRNGGYDIYAQRYDVDGGKAGGNFRVNDDLSSAYQHNPKVAIAANGSFVVTWYDNRAGNDNIMAQRYSSAGSALGANFLVSDIISGNKCVFPDIACDANGNFTVVWIDYRNGNYPENPDAYGRNFSASGDPRGGSFKINTDGSSSAQAEVTIGMDYAGNFITAWRDDRDGDFDIYAQYFNQVGATVGGNYKVNGDDGSATQSFPNVTMDGINIYYTWTDDRNGNFDVYAAITGYGEPSLVLTPMFLNFEVEAGGAAPPPQYVQVRNTGYGILEWSAAASAAWIAVSPQSGAAPDSFQISVIPEGLAGGTHEAKIYISNSARAVADSVQVTLTVNQPLASFCLSNPDLSLLARADGQATSTVTAVNNCGDAPLNWSVADPPPWLNLSVSSGAEGDSLLISVEAATPVGNYLDTIWFEAPQCNNSPYPVSINAAVYPGDSLWLEPANLVRQMTVAVPLHLTSYIPANQVELVLTCQLGMLSLDSLELVSSEWTHTLYDVSAAGDTLTSQFDATTASILAVDDVLALLHITASDSAFEGEHQIGIAATIIDTLGFVSQITAVAGYVEVSAQTDVAEIVSAELPIQPFLLQNFPNPFNLSTEITYGIQRPEFVSLDVFNLLARKIVNLHHGTQRSGTYRASWDGRDDRGMEVASGVYFIRMTTQTSSLVVKAILLK